MAGKKDILRSKKVEVEELLIFGYSCKLFKDDEKARIIDEGQHLIPWMGHENFKIDRYDARGTLSDLNRYEAPPGGYDRFIELTENEKVIEIACDEERYRSLNRNEDEDKLYKEEEEKRMESGETYSQVGYQYVENKMVAHEVKEELEVEDDTPFVPSPMLDIPVNMPLPATVKHNAVIEKTAMFISAQGAQMEIVLKAKQAGNPMFDFLTFGNALHGYYRLILSYIKSGRYTAHIQNPEPAPVEAESYLHPNLGPKPSVELAPSIHSTTNLSEESTSSTVYSDLLSKLKKKANELSKQNEIEKQQENKQIENIKPGSIPPPELQLSISKMAFYASKKGRSFEAIILVKNDPKHKFLENAHPYHEYYIKKFNYYLSLVDKGNVKSSKKKEESSTKIAPICFAIKPKEAPCVREKSALPIEECSDEETEGHEENPKAEEVTVAPENVRNNAVDYMDGDQLDFDLMDDGLQVPNVKNKHIQLERRRKLSEFLKTLNVVSHSVNLADDEASSRSSRKRRKSLTDMFDDSPETP